MDPSTWYLPLRHAHLTLVSLSVALFAARGLGVLARQAWPLGRGPRIGSVLVDTLLLGTGALLWHLLGLNPAVQTWLGVKLGLLLVYIVLGSIALRRGRTPAVRALAYAGALATVATMVGIAIAHHPAGWFAG
ncbi:MAG: hypothetical protein Fur0014_03030 [Rubrivivax sp.]